MNNEVRAKRFVLFIAVLFLFAGALFFFHAGATPVLTVTMLNVGQGDAILITAPTGEHVLIDGGPDETILTELGSVMGFDRTLDLVVLTHPDADHVTGLIPVLERYDVRRILMTGILKDTPEYRIFNERVVERGIPVTYAVRGQEINLPALLLTVLWPDRVLVGVTPDSPNDVSIVFRLTYGDFSMLFTGDIEAGAEKRLLEYDRICERRRGGSEEDRAFARPQATDETSGFCGGRGELGGGNAVSHPSVLKVAHHGSNTSTTQAFLDAVHPTIAMISVGVKNNFGHPSRRVLRHLERLGATVYRTDLDGRITVRTDGKKFDVLDKPHFLR